MSHSNHDDSARPPVTASFPWYDLPAVQWANDTIWSAMYPDASPLNRRMPYERQWHAPDLIVTQACGLDLFLSGAPIRPVLAPVFSLPECREGQYFSYLIGKPGRGIAAVNSLSSRSGCTALLQHASPKAFLITGSHKKSIRAVREKRADFACIDAVTWHLLARDEPEALDGVVRVDRTECAAAPPYVVREDCVSNVSERLESALLDSATQDARRALLVRGVRRVELSDYERSRVEYEQLRDRIPRDHRVDDT